MVGVFDELGTRSLLSTNAVLTKQTGNQAITSQSYIIRQFDEIDDRCVQLCKEDYQKGTFILQLTHFSPIIGERFCGDLRAIPDRNEQGTWRALHFWPNQTAIQSGR